MTATMLRPNSSNLTFGLISSVEPEYLTKVIGFADGKLTKKSFATISEGNAEIRSVKNLEELAAFLCHLRPNQAITLGVPKMSARLVTTRRLPDVPGAIARSRDYFAFQKSPGFLMLDHDGAPNREYDAESLRAQLIAVCPALETAPMLCRPSASSGIFCADGSVLTPLNKHRLYVPVSDASLIPAAARRLLSLLWAHGYGWAEVGNAGQPLERTIIDSSVFQAERLDFAAGPVLLDGLTRKHDLFQIFGNGDALFDLNCILAGPEIDVAADRQRRAARLGVRDGCDVRRSEWASANAANLASMRDITVDQANSVLLRASAHQVLMGDFILHSEDGELVSVHEILANPERWNRSRFADPLGDYPEDRRIATALLTSGMQPVLHSFGHGRQIFELRRQSARILSGRGHRVDTTDNTLKLLSERGELFNFGDSSVAYVTDGRARIVTVDWLVDHMGRVADYYTQRTVHRAGQSSSEERTDDAPVRVAQIILAKHGQRSFKTLKGVITAPTLRPDGSVLDVPGYDPETELFYFAEGDIGSSVPSNPTPEDALAALRYLWRPLSEFPFIDDVSRAVALQAVITACLRASLPAAPGVAFDAPAAGTGKTLLARTIGTIAAGTEVSTFAPVSNDDEMRKRLFACLREGARVVLLDNVKDSFGGAAIDAFLTSSLFSDRVLGESSTSALPNRAMLLVTGNNLRLRGDTLRRVLIARLDAETERAYSREFDFDPVDLVIAARHKYVTSALTLVGAWIAAGRPRSNSPGKLASFELWDELVRKPLCWLRHLIASIADRTGLPVFEDPIKAIGNAFDHDPDKAQLSALLTIWLEKFGSVPITVAKVIERAGTLRDELIEVIDEIAGDRGTINRWRLGRWIERHVGQMTNGKRFARVGEAKNGVALWAVEEVDEGGRIKPSKPGNPDGI